MLVYFGYTHCPDVCPSGLQVISAALDKLGPGAARIAPLFVTLDPERDTPQVMGEYVKSFHPGIIGLTGTPDETAAVAKAYRVYFKKVADENTPGNYSVDHSSFMYLMNGRGEYVKHFSHSANIDDLAGALSALQ
jgi:protein SCO1/2